MTPGAPIAMALIIALYVLVSVSGLTLIKSAEQMVSAPFAAGMALYGGGFLIWIFIILRSLPLSVAFPVAAGALIVGTQIGGVLYLKEQVQITHIAGVLLIMLGIALIFLDKSRI
ncbi:MAG: hypothetical protein VX640_05180 [Pseudomonadota bacterium]|nr:hypothetical protein [Pseudomonadota bacterium]